MFVSFFFPLPSARARAKISEGASSKKQKNPKQNQKKPPNAPLPRPHRVGVELLVEVVQQADRLHDHRVDLVRGELELVARERVREAERHRRQRVVASRSNISSLSPRQTRDEPSQLRPDPAGELRHGPAGHAGDAQLLLDDGAELGVGDAERVAVGVLLEELFQALGHLRVDEGRGGGEGVGGGVELAEGLELDDLFFFVEFWRERRKKRSGLKKEVRKKKESAASSLSLC